MRILLMIALSVLLAMRATPAVAERSRLESTPCAFKDVPANWAKAQRVDCFWLHVPESRGKPDSRKLRLFVAIARADKGVDANAPLLYIHGGPGIATVDYFFPYFPKSRNWPAFRVSRDLVYFDQRGTGRSEPAICPDLGQAFEELRRQGLSPRQELEKTKILFAQCGQKLRSAGFDFGAYNSSATVEDAEDLRRALGAPQWNIYGVSYGSLVGLEYLRRHPESLASAILDSVYPPNSPNGAEQIGATAKAYEALQRACDRDAACAARFPSILETLSVATRRLDAKPLSSQRGPVDGTDFAAALWTMLVDSGFVRWVPLAIERVAKGDDELARKLVRIFGDDGRFGGFSLGQAMTVNCFEIMTGNTADARREMLRRYPQLRRARELPEETDAQCAAWQSVRAPMSFFAPVESTVPVLLYGGEFDPATPFDDAILAARHLPNSTLVFVPGASHAAFSADDCTRSIAYSFVADPTKKPSLECLAARPATEFPVEGLDELLQ